MTTENNKPVVYFVGAPSFWMWDFKNEVAGIPVVLNHPVLGNCPNVRTSTVKQKFPDGSFETRNTMYVPAPKEMLDEYWRKIEETTKEVLSYSQTGLARS